MPNILTDYFNTLKNSCNKLNDLIDAARESYLSITSTPSNSQMNDLVDNALNMVCQAEKTTINARELERILPVKPLQTGIQQCVKESFPCTMSFTSDGWFFMDIPQMAKKKAKQNTATYYYDSLLTSLREFAIKHADNKSLITYDNCVVVYCHVYSDEQRLLYWRDHDNLEYNRTMNCLASFLLKDDDPNTCDMFVTSTIGTEDRTHVYIVPRQDFTTFLTSYYPQKYTQSDTKK